MTPEMAPELARLEARVEFSPWSEASFRSAIENGWICRVLREGGAVRSWAVVMTVMDEAELLLIGTAPEVQRQGFGGRLLRRILAEAADRGARSVFLEVRRSNEAAISLYRKAGFVESGLRRGYYRTAGGREDALLMTLRLGDDA